MIKHSKIYSGQVIHTRFKPKKHNFKYKVFSLLIDLDEISQLDNNLNFFSCLDFLPDTLLRQILKELGFRFFLIIKMTSFSETPYNLKIFSNDDLSCHANLIIKSILLFITFNIITKLKNSILIII